MALNGGTCTIERASASSRSNDATARRCSPTGITLVPFVGASLLSATSVLLLLMLVLL
jgi:hypothetical protein